MLPDRRQDEVKKKEIEDILKRFNPQIKKVLKNTSYQEREDLEQEIKVKILEKVNSLNIESPPGFWEFIKKNNKD